jgi:hypothetical protein
MFYTSFLFDWLHMHPMGLEPRTSSSTPFFMEGGNAVYARAHWLYVLHFYKTFGEK